MKKNLLGKTGINVTCLGFGGIPIQRLTQQDATDIIVELKNQGINFIDTAIGYTVSETYIGNALKVVGRENFYIATKAMGYTYDSMKTYIEQSLKQLDVDYIDIYQIHNLSKPEQYEAVFSENGAMKALYEAKEKGLIKHIGVTSHSASMLDKLLDLEVFDTIQFPYNIVEQHGTDLFKKAISKNVGTICMKPMAGGALEDTNLALKYIFGSGLLSVAIPGMDSVEQVRENAEIAKKDFNLNESDLEKIEIIRKELGNDFCRRCGYCLPCPSGIDIPSMFLFEGYYTRYNLNDWAKDRYSTVKIKPDACVKCGICEEKCPYDLPIREKLVSVLKHLEN